MPLLDLLPIADVLCYPDRQMSNQSNAATAGISFGSALAMILSFQLNHSILWAIVHGVCSWFYVIYRALKGNY